MELITLERGQADAVVNPPLPSGLARFLHYRGIQQPHRLSLQRRFQADSVILPQLPAQLSQPFFRLSEPVEQGHIRHIRNPRQFGMHRCLA